MLVCELAKNNSHIAGGERFDRDTVFMMVKMFDHDENMKLDFDGMHSMYRADIDRIFGTIRLY
jgi:hypothetical protein